MSDGSIKPSVGSIKTTRSAISKVTGETQAGIDKDAQNLSLFKDSSKLAALRPGSLAEEINNQKKDSENSEKALSVEEPSCCLHTKAALTFENVCFFF